MVSMIIACMYVYGSLFIPVHASDMIDCKAFRIDWPSD